MTVGLLVFCLDGGDIKHFHHHSNTHNLSSLSQALTYSTGLPSTIIPQTPVAWSTFLCGAEPEKTGIWGWQHFSHKGSVEFLQRGILPLSYQDWREVPILIAGLPLLNSQKGLWGKSLEGLAGPGQLSGASRPKLTKWRSCTDLYAKWKEHHKIWAKQIIAAAEDIPLALVHCDSVDWFSHRFGPSSDEASLGWKLANELLRLLLEAFNPLFTVIVSDHGSVEVNRVIRIHQALFREGLSSKPPSALKTLDDVISEPVCCISDYGALWCKDSSLQIVTKAEQLLWSLGANKVHHINSCLSQSPTLVPEFQDGCIVLTQPALYSEFCEDNQISVVDVDEALKRHNWIGDHSRYGLIGTNNADVWSDIKDASLANLKYRLIEIFQ